MTRTDRVTPPAVDAVRRGAAGAQADSPATPEPIALSAEPTLTGTTGAPGGTGRKVSAGATSARLEADSALGSLKALVGGIARDFIAARTGVFTRRGPAKTAPTTLAAQTVGGGRTRAEGLIGKTKPTAAVSLASVSVRTEVSGLTGLHAPLFSVGKYGTSVICPAIGICLTSFTEFLVRLNLFRLTGLALTALARPAVPVGIAPDGGAFSALGNAYFEAQPHLSTPEPLGTAAVLAAILDASVPLSREPETDVVLPAALTGRGTRFTEVGNSWNRLLNALSVGAVHTVSAVRIFRTLAGIGVTYGVDVVFVKTLKGPRLAGVVHQPLNNLGVGEPQGVADLVGGNGDEVDLIGADVGVNPPVPAARTGIEYNIGIYQLPRSQRNRKGKGQCRRTNPHPGPFGR